MGDNANSIDHGVFARFFSARVAPTDQDPASILYSSFTSPRHYATRWFHEGIATFMETWMAGGLGRAMGGWDEMAFRAMVRDDAYIYDAVGLGVGGNRQRIYTNFRGSLLSIRHPIHDVAVLSIRPGQAGRMGQPRRKYAALFSERASRRCMGWEMDTAWKLWIPDERRFQEANLAEIRKYPVTKPEHLTTKALGSVSRAYFDSKTNQLYAAIRYPGHMASIAAIHADTGAIDELKDIGGPALYYVTSVAWDAAGRKSCTTPLITTTGEI